jgi:amino acid transporter
MSNISEETKQPEKTVPRGLLIAVTVTTVLYGLVGLAVVSLVPWQELSMSAAPLAYAVSVDLGPVAYGLLSTIALLTTLNTVLVLLIVSSRIIYGMGREGALPGVLGRLNKRTSTPIVASVVALLVALSFLPLGKIDVVAKITSFGSLLTFTLVNLSLLHLRRVAPNISRPFKAPLSIGWVSITALLGMISCILMLTQFDALSIVLGLLLPLSGAIVYSLMGGKMTVRTDRGLHEQHGRI